MHQDLKELAPYYWMSQVLRSCFWATGDSVILKAVSATHTPYPEDSVLELAQYWVAWVSLSIFLSLSHDPSSITSLYTSGSLKEAGCKATVHLFCSLPTLCDPTDHSPPGSSVHGRQEYWSGLPCPPPGDFPDPRIEPGSPELQADSLPPESSGKPP